VQAALQDGVHLSYDTTEKRSLPRDMAFLPTLQAALEESWRIARCYKHEGHGILSKITKMQHANSGGHPQISIESRHLTKSTRVKKYKAANLVGPKWNPTLLLEQNAVEFYMSLPYSAF